MQSQKAAAPTQPESTQEPTQPQDQSTTQPGQNTTAAQGESVIATRKLNDHGAVLRVDVTELRRDGKMATLSWNITVESGKYWVAGTTMGTHNTDFTVANVSLIDTQNSKRYRVARSQGEEGTCACTKTDPTTVQQGGSLSFQATYAAPPPR